MLILAVLVLLALSVVAQTTEITEQQFWAKVYAAREAGEKYNRRETWTRESLRNGKLSQEIWSVREYLLPNKVHWIKTQESAGTTNTTEQIEIGEEKYCRKNKDVWTRRDCTEMMLSSGAPPRIKKFTVQTMTFEGKQVNVYTRSHTFEKTFEDFRFFEDNGGRVLREEIEYGNINPKSLTMKSVTVSEYDPKDLKIEAPGGFAKKP